MCWRTLLSDTFAFHWIPHMSKMAVVNWHCTFTLTFRLFDEPHTAPFNVLASTKPITFACSGPFGFHIASFCNTTVKTLTGQSIAGFVSDGWPEGVTFFIIVFVVRAIGACSGRYFFSFVFFMAHHYITCGQCWGNESIIYLCLLLLLLTSGMSGILGSKISVSSAIGVVTGSKFSSPLMLLVYIRNMKHPKIWLART